MKQTKEGYNPASVTIGGVLKQSVPAEPGRFSAKQLVRRIQNQQFKTCFD
jgi:hypothetical protein